MTRIRAWLRLKLGWIPRPVRRVIVSVIGGTLLLLALIGVIMPIMPGFIFLPFGLAILAVEFAWAARWLKKIRRTAQGVRDRWRGSSADATPAGDVAADASCETAASKPLPLPPTSMPAPTPPIVRHRPNAAA